MDEEEKKAVESLKIKAEFIGDNYSFGIQGIINLRNELKILLNLIEKQQKELEQEKEKNKEFQKYKTYYEEMEEVNKKFIAVDKIKERMEQTKKVYDEEMKPYMIEVGNGEKVLNVTGLNKKEKEELINKRNCLLVQIKTYEMLLEEK